MALVANLQKQFLEYAASLFNEELVNEQFARVQQSNSEMNPNFSVNLISVYFRDSERLINSLSENLEEPKVNFSGVDQLAQHLRGSSSTVGAAKIESICAELHELYQNTDVEMLKQYVQQLQYEKSILKSKLDTLFRLERHILAAGGTVPVIKLKPTVCNLESPDRD